MKRSNDIAVQMHLSSSLLSVFCAAAPADETLLLQWETYLLPLQQAHLISCWSTRHVAAGTDIEQERSSHLDRAELILLLLSADFFASDECLAVMQQALERQRTGSARVIPLLLRQVEWQETELARLVSLPANGVPVAQWTIRDEAWHACVLGIQPILRQRLAASSLVFKSVRAQRRASSDRERLLGRLSHTYQDLLDHSLEGSTWMELGLASKPDAVRNASHLLLRLPERDEQALTPGTSILHAYEQAQEELLILGAPGAGKSTLLLNLALQLVERTLADETHPLPIILPLSSWAVQRPPFVEWIIEQFTLIYEVPHVLSRRWVELEHVLPLLDGLDEMEEAARSACIAAINTYHREHLTPLVVCSRQDEYDLAATRQRLMLQSAIVVQPLTSEQVELSLHTAGTAFAGVRAALEHQPALRELATTPLMLSVLLLTYQGSSLDAVVQPGADLEQRVWTDYVARIVKQKGNETHYALVQTCRWLAYLAQQMRVHQQTIFYAEYLDADWLTHKQQRTLAWLTVRVPALVLGGLASILLFLLFAPNAYVYDPVYLLQVGLLGGFVGGCLSRKADTRVDIVRRHPSASKYVYLMSGMLFGVLIAASFGLSLASPSSGYSLSDWVQDGSVLGLGSGLSACVFQMLLFRLSRQHRSVSSTHPSRRYWYIGPWFNTIVPQSVWVAALGLSYGVIYRLNIGLSIGVSVWLMAVLVNIILDISLLQYPEMDRRKRENLMLHPMRPDIGNSARTMPNASSDFALGTLRFAERIHWTWHSLLRSRHLSISMIVAGIVFLLYGVSYGSSYGLVYGLGIGLSVGLIYGLGIGLSVGLIYWLLLGLYQGVVQEHVEDQDRHQFNQGIRRSLRNGMIVSLVGASIIAGMEVLSVGLNLGLSVSLRVGLSFELSDALNYLRYGLGYGWILAISGFLVMWAMSGGLTVLRHYVIRWFLARARRFPWRAQAFLDDATARILLQRVGGGYRFMHRRLLDYFADLDGAATSESALPVPGETSNASHEQTI